MKLNVKRLRVKKGKKYTEVLFFGDWHYGHPTAVSDKAIANLKYCLDNDVYVITMGDLVECSIKSSIGNVYEQLHDPQNQMDYIREILRPLAERGLILNMYNGNHEYRIEKETSLKITQNIARELKVPYGGYAGWNLLRVGNQNYKVYGTHGSSGSKHPHTKLKAAIDVSLQMEADLTVYAHVHELMTYSYDRRVVDLRNKTVKTRKRYVVITGHYLSYEGSYAEMKGYPPSKIGSPKVKFFSDKYDIHVSI